MANVYEWVNQVMAGRYPSYWLDELRARADIVKIINTYVPLKKNGHRYVGLCPFHHETAPSFSVDAQKQVYHCFGCKAGGSVLQFVMEMERLSFPEAVAYLADQLHMPLPALENDPGYEKRRTIKERIYLANKEAAKLYHQWLWQPQCAHILSYLQERGLSDAIIRRFGIGATPSGSHMGAVLMKMGFSQEELVGAGLMITRNDRTFDMFHDRALFPIIDTYGNVLGFGGRAMGDQMPKYLNTGDTPAFNKRYTVYAANLLRKTRGLARVILVEGYMDVVALSQFGIQGVVATLGTALTPEQSKLIGRFAPEVVIAYDGDKAGQKAILRGIEVLEGEKVPVRVLDFPDNLDPDEFIRKHGVDAFTSLKPLTAVRYRLLRQKEQFDMSTEDGRTQYAKACASILSTVTEPVELENYLRQLCLETGYSREVLLAQVGITPKAEPLQMPKRQSFVKKARDVSAIDWTARTLLAVIATGRLPVGSISSEEFEDDVLRSLCEAMLAGQTPASLMESQPDEESRAVLGDILSLNTDLDDAGLMQMAKDCIQKMQKARLEKQLDTITKTLPTLPEDERETQTKRAYLLTKQLLDMQ